MDYITLNEEFTAVLPIPRSASGDTVTATVFDASDGSTFSSGAATYVAGEYWKYTFTPDSNTTLIVRFENSTIDSIRENIYKVIGASITTPDVPDSGDLTTLANFKTNFNIEGTDNDTLISNLITQVSKSIQNECQRTFASTAYTSESDNTLYDGDGTDTVMLRQTPVISVSSVYDDLNREFNADDLISSDDYSIHSESGILFLDGLTFQKGKRNVRVYYTAGYSTIPSDIVNACENIVMAEYLEHVSSVNVDTSDEVIYRPDKLRKNAQKIIDRYKVIR